MSEKVSDEDLERVLASAIYTSRDVSIMARELIDLRAKVEAEWRDIATAPKNVPILATNGKVIVVLERGECAGDDWPGAVGFGGWEWDWDFNWKDLTHWMPLPPVPTSEKAG